MTFNCKNAVNHVPEWLSVFYINYIGASVVKMENQNAIKLDIVNSFQGEMFNFEYYLANFFFGLQTR